MQCEPIQAAAYPTSVSISPEHFVCACLQTLRCNLSLRARTQTRTLTHAHMHTYTNWQMRLPQTDYGCLSDKLSTFVHFGKFSLSNCVSSVSPVCFPFRGSLPSAFLAVSRQFRAGSAWHPLTWHRETVSWLPPVDQHHSQPQCLLPCDSCAFGETLVSEGKVFLLIIPSAFDYVLARLRERRRLFSHHSQMG